MSDIQDLCVLIIDDEEMVRQSLLMFLEDAGYRVITAENGRIGLEKFSEHSPDIVLVDLRMPEMDGLEVVTRLHESSPDTPVLVVSGAGVVSDAIQAIRLGAWDYLMKPIFDLEILNHAIMRAVEKVRLIKENRNYQKHLEEEVERRTRELRRINQDLEKEIEAHRATERALRKSEERLKLALRGADMGLWDWNMVRDEAFYDTGSMKILGYNEEEFRKLIPLGKSILHPEDVFKVGKALEDHLQGLTPFYEMEMRLRAKNGEWKWILDRGMVVKRNTDGKPLRMAGTYLDITDRKQMELEQKILQHQLAQSQKMESIGTLAGGVAHDFNNMLTVINGHTELALIRKDPEAIKKDLHIILESAGRASELTRQLLAFSRKQVIEPVVVNINKIIRNIESMIIRLIGEDIEIRRELADNLPNIEADPGQLEQILMNLVVNARDAINESGKSPADRRIRISTKLLHREDMMVSRFSECTAGSYITITVADTGTGMSPELKEKIFEPFFTTKSIEKGTGLGLSTVYGIVRQNKGFIHVDSKPGEGAEFRICWPVSEKPASGQQKGSKAADELRGSETILVVEDETNVREFACNVLKDFGYDVLQASNGEDALRIVFEGVDRIDLLITDVVMPRMSGKDLAEKICGKIGDIKILFISGYTEEHISMENKPIPRATYLSKPFTVHGLLRKIREVL